MSLEGLKSSALSGVPFLSAAHANTRTHRERFASAGQTGTEPNSGRALRKQSEGEGGGTTSFGAGKIPGLAHTSRGLLCVLLSTRSLLATQNQAPSRSGHRGVFLRGPRWPFDEWQAVALAVFLVSALSSAATACEKPETLFSLAGTVMDFLR